MKCAVGLELSQEKWYHSPQWQRATPEEQQSKPARGFKASCVVHYVVYCGPREIALRAQEFQDEQETRFIVHSAGRWRIVTCHVFPG